MLQWEVNLSGLLALHLVSWRNCSEDDAVAVKIYQQWNIFEKVLALRPHGYISVSLVAQVGSGSCCPLSLLQNRSPESLPAPRQHWVNWVRWPCGKPATSNRLFPERSAQVTPKTLELLCEHSDTSSGKCLLSIPLSGWVKEIFNYLDNIQKESNVMSMCVSVFYQHKFRVFALLVSTRP